MSKLIDIASAEVGVTEIEGAKHNQRILEYAREAGFDWVNSDETPWCSIFLNWATKKAGLERSKDARSRSWRNVGKAVQKPLHGDVVMFGTDGDINRIYHVGIFMGFSEDGKRVFCLGGNQTNKVSISKSWRANVAGFRRIEALEDNPIESEPPHREEEVEELSKGNPKPVVKTEDTPKPQTTEQKEEVQRQAKVLSQLIYKLLNKKKLRKGAKGSQVEDLQRGLHMAGFNCGIVDGDFGNKTEIALKQLQKQAGIKQNGVFNRRTRRYLAKLLTR
jgi:uncharacterized protein (TIGR02594 family)